VLQFRLIVPADRTGAATELITATVGATHLTVLKVPPWTRPVTW
jgi:hypothetical protein